MPEIETTTEMTHDEWRQQFTNTVHALVAVNRRFTSEDVTDIIGPPPSKSPNAVGSQMGALAKRKIIFRTGETRIAEDKRKHGARLTMWSGTKPAPVTTPTDPYQRTSRYEYSVTCPNCYVTTVELSTSLPLNERLEILRRWEIRHRCRRDY